MSNNDFLNDYSKIMKLSLQSIVSRLNENEIENLKKILETFDQKKDGKITYEDLKEGLNQLKSNKYTINDVNKIFEKIDAKKLKFDYMEFLRLVNQEAFYLKKERLLETYCLFDS